MAARRSYYRRSKLGKRFLVRASATGSLAMTHVAARNRPAWNPISPIVKVVDKAADWLTKPVHSGDPGIGYVKLPSKKDPPAKKGKRR